jgi:mono/diheme cytochrome c family protein
MRVLLICLAVAVAAAQTAAAQPMARNAENGKKLAELWCSSCHLVSPEQKSATTEAPPFATIAEHSTDELAWLAPFLADPHPPMPQFSLTRNEIRDLVAYFSSLKDSD